jgi:hypothetical protein
VRAFTEFAAGSFRAVVTGLGDVAEVTPNQEDVQGVEE